MSKDTKRMRDASASQRGARENMRRAAVALGIAVVVGLAVWLAFSPDTDGPDGDDSGVAVEEISHVHGLQIPAWGDGDVYVSTHQGAFRVSADVDWSWISEESHDFMGFAAHPTDDGVLYSSGHPAPGSDLANPIGFMVSTDAGATWQPKSLQGEVDFHTMAVHPTDGDVVYGYDGRRGLLRTDDGGDTWEDIATSTLEQAGVMSLAVGPGDGEVYAGTEAGLLRSLDAGTSWESLIEAPVTAVAVDVSDPQRLLAYAVADGQGLLASDDGGGNWEPLGLMLDEDAAGHVAVDPNRPDTVWVGTFDQSLWTTSDGGQQWEQLVEDGVRTTG